MRGRMERAASGPSDDRTGRMHMRTIGTRCTKTVALGLMLMAGMVATQKVAAETVGFLVESVGTVERAVGGSTRWRPIATSDTVSAGDRVRTGNDGRAVILMDDDQLIEVPSDARIEIEAAGRGGILGVLGGAWDWLVSRFEGDVSSMSNYVGSFRPGNVDHHDEWLGSRDRADLDADLATLGEAPGIAPETRMVLSAIVYERYEQYATASDLYEDVLSSPEATEGTRELAGMLKSRLDLSADEDEDLF